MNGGIDISTLAEVAKDQASANNIAGWLKEIAENLKYVEQILGTFQKMGVSPAVLEKVAIKFGGLDKVPDLPNSSRGIVPVSNNHRAVFENLNNLSEAELIQLSKDMEAAKKK